MDDQEGAFLNVSSQALSVLVLGLNSRLDAALAEMLRMRWDAIEAPGDDSPYVGLARQVRCGAACSFVPLLGCKSGRFWAAGVQQISAPVGVQSYVRGCASICTLRILTRAPSQPPIHAARLQLLTDAAPRLGAALASSHFSFFCDKMARMFVPRYLDCVFRLKK